MLLSLEDSSQRETTESAKIEVPLRMPPVLNTSIPQPFITMQGKETASEDLFSFLGNRAQAPEPSVPAQPLPYRHKSVPVYKWGLNLTMVTTRALEHFWRGSKS